MFLTSFFDFTNKALLRDRILNKAFESTLIDMGFRNSGKIAKLQGSFHNGNTLSKLDQYLEIHKHMKSLDLNYNF